jgi:hypothetical protein
MPSTTPSPRRRSSASGRGRLDDYLGSQSLDNPSLTRSASRRLCAKQSAELPMRLRGSDPYEIEGEGDGIACEA